MSIFKFLPLEYRVFTTQEKLVPTGLLEDTIDKHKGYVKARKLVNQDEKVFAIINKMIEELTETRNLFLKHPKPAMMNLATYDMEAHRLKLAAECGDIFSTEAYVHEVLPHSPVLQLKPVSLELLVGYWQKLALETTTGHWYARTVELTQHTITSLRQVMSMNGVLMHEVEAAIHEKQKAFGKHEGWVLSAMALSWDDPLCEKLQPPQWQRVALSMFDMNDALSIEELTVTPTG